MTEEQIRGCMEKLADDTRLHSGNQKRGKLECPYCGTDHLYGRCFEIVLWDNHTRNSEWRFRGE